MIAEDAALRPGIRIVLPRGKFWALFEGAETFARFLVSDGRRSKLVGVRIDDPALTERIRRELKQGDMAEWQVQTDRANPTPCVLLDFHALGA